MERRTRTDLEGVFKQPFFSESGSGGEPGGWGSSWDWDWWRRDPDPARQCYRITRMESNSNVGKVGMFYSLFVRATFHVFCACLLGPPAVGGATLKVEVCGPCKTAADWEECSGHKDCETEGEIVLLGGPPFSDADLDQKVADWGQHQLESADPGDCPNTAEMDSVDCGCESGEGGN